MPRKHEYSAHAEVSKPSKRTRNPISKEWMSHLHLPAKNPAPGAVRESEASSSTAELPSLKPTKKQQSMSLPPVTVKSIMRGPSSAVIDEEEICGYPTALTSRIEKLMAFENPRSNIYSLATLLPTASWGQNDPYSDRSKMLCNPVSNKPILIWMVGHVSATWFLRNGQPDRQCSVTIVPLSKHLCQQALRLRSGFSHPPLPSADTPPSVVRASHWQSSKHGEMSSLFSSVYNAREVFQAKTEMDLYPAMELKKRDLILLEVKLIWYFVKDNNSCYSHHRAQFKLQSVSLLHSSDGNESDNSSNYDIGDLFVGDNFCIAVHYSNTNISISPFGDTRRKPTSDKA
ncbi:hypothetical protein BKA82DRAFT_4015956 [Pisolithus tinctorius]|nr:hypothetical protein BKA82DRAFT_4015956 [Pisolithus tinctorius]